MIAISKSKNDLVNQVIAATREVVGSGSIPLHEPFFDESELSYLRACLDSTYVSSVGKYVKQFEENLISYTGARYAVAVVNGTSALFISLKLAGVGSNDEVLIPALTFVATANAVSYCGAIPHLIDSEEKTLGMSPTSLRDYLADITELRENQCINRLTGRVIRAMIPVHTFGHPADIDALLDIARDYHLIMVEDAAESLGSFYNGRHTGTFGHFGVISFNGNKIITTGGGGVILTNNKFLAQYAQHLITTAKIPHLWEYRHDDIGYNFRLPNLNAALGCAQLERLDTLLSAKRKLHSHYLNAFKAISGATLISEPENCSSNYWLQTLLLDPSYANYRDEILNQTNQQGLMTRPSWVLMSELSPYANCPQMDLRVSKSLAKRLINLPSSPSILLRRSDE